MTPEMKKHLEAVVVAIANEQTADAKSEFSKYLRLKTQSILVGEAEHDDEDKDMDKDEDKEEEKHEDEDKEEEKHEDEDKEEEKDEEDEEHEKKKKH